MSELTSASVPPIGENDHVTGEGVEAIVYADFGCPYCAADWARLRELPLRLCFRHFPMASKHPRAPALHAAAEAAGAQGAFWEMCDSLYADRGRVDDPHLWERARALRPRPRALPGRQPLRRGPRARRAGFRQRDPGRGRRDAMAFADGRAIQAEVIEELAAIAAG